MGAMILLVTSAWWRMVYGNPAVSMPVTADIRLEYNGKIQAHGDGQCQQVRDQRRMTGNKAVTGTPL